MTSCRLEYQRELSLLVYNPISIKQLLFEFSKFDY